MDIGAVDGDKINEDNKPVDSEKVHFTEFAFKNRWTAGHPTVSRNTAPATPSAPAPSTEEIIGLTCVY